MINAVRAGEGFRLARINDCNGFAEYLILWLIIQMVIHIYLIKQSLRLVLNK